MSAHDKAWLASLLGYVIGTGLGLLLLPYLSELISWRDERSKQRKKLKEITQ